MKTKHPCLAGVTVLAMLFFSVQLRAQNVEVDVNENIRHSVNGISDFGRERHITFHSNIYENDWEGELDKADYLLNELDAYLGRDNGTASFLFAFSPSDPNRPNKHDPDSLTQLLDFWKVFFDDRLTAQNRDQFKNKISSMIMGTNPHPTYPTLSYRHPSGSQWGRNNGQIWIPQDIETSAEWMVQYMDEFFSNGGTDPGMPMPKYWEVVNEPDLLLNTGQFMMSSWEDIWEYHNLVAQGVRQKLGNRAPKIGGMTWAQHDLFATDGISRFKTPDYVNGFYGNTPGDEIAKAYARSQVTSPFLGQNAPWFQWDVLWKGFIDAAGSNMDYYSVHLYDWPTYNSNGGVTRRGGHTEAVLEMLESYDVSKNGKNNRKPIIISEYGAVSGQWEFTPHDRRYDWESIKPFSAMLMQFLERPDYIELSMPFTPIKAVWGDTDSNGDGTPEYFYQYKMLRDDDQDGVWEWSDYIKWFELWSEVKGTRVDTKSTDPDIQVDAYVDGNTTYLILNNLEPVAKEINLNLFGNRPNLQEVSSKHLYLSGIRNIILDNQNYSSAPGTVQLDADATMILKYTYSGSVNVNENSVERKFFGNEVSPNQRIHIQNGDNTFFVNGVRVPPNTDQAEAMLKVTVNLFNDDDDEEGFLSIDRFTFNGVEVDAPLDWRGGNQQRSRWFGTLELPVPTNLIQPNNTITLDFRHVGEVCTVNLLTWEFTSKPGRSDEGPGGSDPVPVTGVSVSPGNVTLQPGQALQLSGSVSPTNATNKSVTWSSNNTAVATVSNSGLVTAVAAGSAMITVTTVDGGFTTNSAISVSNSGGGGGATLVIEAESFVGTGGSFNDAFVGGPGLGVNRTGVGINYVNSGDWAEYDLNVQEAGTYAITYEISTPSSAAQVQLLVDGVLAATTNVPNNGQWDSYGPSSGGTVSLSAGPHTIRINASGSNTWQWNLDKITLVSGSGGRLATLGNVPATSANAPFSGDVLLYPNPAQNELKFVGQNIEQVVIYNILGAKMFQSSLTSDGSMDISALSEGVYSVHVIGQGLNETHKVVIKR